MFYAFSNVKTINSIILRNIKRLKQFFKAKPIKLFYTHFNTRLVTFNNH